MNIIIAIGLLIILCIAYKYLMYFYVQSKHVNGLQYKNKKYWLLTNVDSYDVDNKFYLRTDAELKSLGFKKLGDLGTDITDKTYISVYKNPENTINVSVYSIKTDGVAGYTFSNSIDFESETNDGEFYATTNAWLSRHIKVPKEIHMTYLEPDTSIDAIYQQHLINMNGKSLLSIETIDELIASQERMNEIKAIYRKKIGETVTISEIQQVHKNLKTDIEKYQKIENSEKV